MEKKKLKKQNKFAHFVYSTLKFFLHQVDLRTTIPQ